MNRRQKIIVSVTGIFIVLLILIGLTYAYFLTRITGNSNPTSISVTTANLELVYGDGTTAILTSETPLMPSSTPIGTKDFTVTNNGDDSEYVVVFEDVTVKYAADTVINGQAVTAGTDTTFESNDFVYTLTCTVKDKSGNTLSDKSCDGVEEETFPMDGGIVLGNSIDKNDVHNYVLTMYYLETGLDQSADMNKTLNGKVNIKDIKSINPYSEKTSSLAYNIINNSMLAKNGTELVSTTPSKVGKEISKENWELEDKIVNYEYETIKLNSISMYSSNPSAEFTKCEYGGGCDEDIEYSPKTCEDVLGKYIHWTPGLNSSYYEYYDYYYPLVEKCENGEIKLLSKIIYSPEQVLSTTRDDYGISYYYRGNVVDNYVNFAGMCWRIVRIEGDGSVKLTLEDQYATCNDTEDTDGEETADYAYTGNWVIGKGTYGFDDYSSPDAPNFYRINYYYNDGMGISFVNFQKNKLINVFSKLKSGDWCYDLNTYQDVNGAQIEYDNDAVSLFYGSYKRLINETPSLKCNGTKIDKFDSNNLMYVGALTADEVTFAGGKNRTDNSNFYLINNYQTNNTDINFLTLSPSHRNDCDFAFYVDGNGKIESMPLHYSNNNGFRPSISLLANTEIISGTGIQSDPYIVE